MTSCIVLSDATVHDVLINLSKEDISSFIDQVSGSLRDFSVGDVRSYQPEAAAVKHADGRKNLFRPFTSSKGVGVKIIVDPSAALKAQGEPATDAERAERNRLVGLHGILALCDQNGFPQGFINAEEITGYRTSLSAIILYVKRKVTANIVVFGAGKQALWHMRLALALRGEDIDRITVINRSTGRTKDLLDQIRTENKARWKANVHFDYKLPDDANAVQAVLSEADVVFCTTPSREVLFPAGYLVKRKTGCYVSAIGSWMSDMIELDPELVKSAAQQEDHTQSLFVVDDRTACVKDTGEVIRSKIGEDKIREVGELIDVLAKPSDDNQAKIKKTLEAGFVVYKSIGVSLTDLSAGQALLALAKQRNQGLAVSDF